MILFQNLWRGLGNGLEKCGDSPCFVLILIATVTYALLGLVYFASFKLLNLKTPAGLKKEVKEIMFIEREIHKSVPMRVELIIANMIHNIHVSNIG